MANSFEDLNKAELLAVAEMFAVDAKPAMAKADIIKELTDMGVDYQSYQALLRADAEVGVPEELAALQEPEPEAPQGIYYGEPHPDAGEELQPEPEEDYVVVKMTRENVRYDTGTYRFTRDNPFVLMKEEDADRLFECEEGFRIATPRELREYYGR